MRAPSLSSGRRRFLVRSGASIVTAATCGLPVLRAAAAAQTARPLTDLSAAEAVAAMRDGSLTAEAYANALLERARRCADLNAFITLRPDLVREAARTADKRRARGASLARLHGLPLPVKDSINTRALPTTEGTASLRRFQPKRDAPILEPLFAAGAILMGKTNLHELSCGWSSNNLTFGPVRNPYDPSRTPGGSSGGSAAAVSAGIAPIALGEDTFGSIRVPASYCGVAGLRPTFDRYPNAGTLPLTLNKFDQLGLLAREVEDLALLDSVITGDSRPLEARALHEVRIGYDPDFFGAGIDAELGVIIERALEHLRSAGATLVRAELPAEARAAYQVEEGIFGYEMLDSMAQFLTGQQTGVTLDQLIAQAGPNLAPLLEQSRTHGTRARYEELLQQLKQVKATMAQYFRSRALDAVAFSPTLMPAFKQGDPQTVTIGNKQVDLLTAIGRNVGVGSCAGLACLVVPAGQTIGGLPVGLELDAPAGSDRRLLSLGLSVERALGRIPAPQPG
ncbi:MAG: amidase family protein [Steroidobacteraceae bacterium]